MEALVKLGKETGVVETVGQLYEASHYTKQARLNAESSVPVPRSNIDVSVA